jgi:hypothetical protein
MGRRTLLTDSTVKPSPSHWFICISTRYLFSSFISRTHGNHV